MDKNTVDDRPIGKLFMLNGKFYLYDTNTNRILELSEEYYIAINNLFRVGKKKYLDTNDTVKEYDGIKWLMEKQYLAVSITDEIVNPETGYIPYLLDRCVSNLILQVTRDCNFKCRYCLFASDGVVERTHEDKNMSWNVAKQAIDFLYDHSVDSRSLSLAFYGGEPMLNFPLIKKCAEYAKSIFCLRPVKFLMTINGSILTNEMLAFLVKNEFDLTFSIDGIEETQNKHRKFSETGGGTYDIVFNNIYKIKEENSDYFNRHVAIAPVFFDDENLEAVKSLMHRMKISENNVIVRNANLSGIDYIPKKPVFWNNNNTVYDSYIRNKEALMQECFNDKTRIPSKWHHGGPCIPGVQYLFVDIYGNFYPCEKALESKAMQIGTLSNGISLDKVIQFSNIGKLTEDYCKHCWAIRFCDLCVTQCLDVEKNTISKRQKLYNCELLKEKSLNFLKKKVKEAENR